jgi:hypothetical protein
MAGLRLKTHDVDVNRSGEAVATRVTPYIRLCEGVGPPIFLQGGGYFYEGGEEVPTKDRPEWLSKLQGACSKEALEACGFKKT